MLDEKKDRTPRWIPLLGVLAGGLQLLRFAGPQFAMDDAWISFRIARNLLEHGTLTFDPALAPAEGMTNLLWTLLSAVWIGLLPQIDPIVVARIVGGTMYLGTILVAGALAGRIAGRCGGSRAQATLAASLLLASSGSMAFHALSGLETALWGLLFVLTLERLDAAIAGTRAAAPLAGLCLALLALCRPEGVGVGIAIGLWLVARPATRRLVVPVGLPFVLAVAGVEAFRLAVYGSLVPNTFYAKPPYAASGWAYLGRFLLMGTGGLGLLAVLPALRRPSTTRLMGWLLLATAAGTVWSGGDWMPGYRRLTLAFLCLGLLAAVSFACAAPRSRRLILVAASCIVVGNLAGAVARRDGAAYNTQVLADLGRLADASPGVRTVALTDIGRFGWAYDGSIFDLVGLTDAHLGRLPGVHGKKRWDEDYFRSRRPDLVFVQNDRPLTDLSRVQLHTRSSETAVLHSMLTRGGYDYRSSVPLGRDVWLVVFGREGLELPEELWGPPPETGPRDGFEVEPAR